MSSTINLNVAVDESPIPAALDAFYDFIKSVAPPGPDDKMAIFGTIVEYDISPKSILYNDFVVRAFADRSVRVSPVAGQAPADLSDRYSSRFSDMIAELVSETDVELTQAQEATIARAEAAIDAISSDRDAYLTGIEAAWRTEMQTLGIDPSQIATDPIVRKRYYDERVKFLITRGYAEKVWGVDGFNTRIKQREITIAGVRRQAFPDDDYAQLYNLYTYSVDPTSKVIRPRTPDLEITHNWDAITIQDPTNNAFQAVLDIALETTSIVDPRAILNGAGKRGFSVDISSKVTNDHDHDWNVSGSASFMPFISGSFNTQNSDHYRSTISKVRQVEVSFEHLAELQIIRDRWFDSTVLSDNKRVVKFLKNHPTLAEKLALLTTGLILGRGLTLTLTFTDVSDVQEWGSSTTSVGGGVSIFGFDLDAGGQTSSSYNNHIINTNNKTVTFKDDPTVCRLIGLRTTPLKVGVSLAQILQGGRPLWQIPALQKAALRSLARGKVPNLQDLMRSSASDKVETEENERD